MHCLVCRQFFARENSKRLLFDPQRDKFRCPESTQLVKSIVWADTMLGHGLCCEWSKGTLSSFIVTLFTLYVQGYLALRLPPLGHPLDNSWSQTFLSPQTKTMHIFRIGSHNSWHLHTTLEHSCHTPRRATSSPKRALFGTVWPLEGGSIGSQIGTIVRPMGGKAGLQGGLYPVRLQWRLGSARHIWQYHGLIIPATVQRLVYAYD